MHRFLIAFIFLGLGASLFLGSFLSSLACSLILFFILWARLFSKRIILNSFVQKKPLHETPYFRKKQVITNTLKKTDDDLELYVVDDKSNLQIYCIDQKPLCLAFSKTLLAEHKSEELNQVLLSAEQLLNHNTFKQRQHIVALFLHLGSALKKIDRVLCFVFGISSVNGQPRPVVRALFSPLLNWICSLLSPPIMKPSDLIDSLGSRILLEQSYLDRKHSNSLLGPLSLVDSLIYADD